MKLDSAVLAGGRSRRMGHDKPLVLLDGERLIDRVLQRLAALDGRTVIVRGNQEAIPDVDVPQISDRLPQAGPLAGIEAALGHLSTPLVAIVAVDLPEVSVGVLTALAARWDGESPAVVPEVAGRLQPLHAVWSRDALPTLTASLDAGERSPASFAAAHDAQVVDRAVWGQLDPNARFARNLNRPDELGR